MSGFDQYWAKNVTEKLDKLEARISRLESVLLLTESKKRLVLPKSSKGPSGTISKLIKAGFLDTPKTRREVQNELERQGYYYRAPVIHTALTRDFMKKKGILTRVGKKGEWRFVLKK